MTILTPSQIYQQVLSAGFTGQNAVTMTAIGLAESSGNPNALNTANRNGTADFGLFQINSSHLGEGNIPADPNALNDPATNAAAAFQLSGGSNFIPWSTFNSGAFQSFLPQAQSAADSFTGAVDTPVSQGAAAVPVPSSPADGLSGSGLDTGPLNFSGDNSSVSDLPSSDDGITSPVAGNAAGGFASTGVGTPITGDQLSTVGSDQNDATFAAVGGGSSSATTPAASADTTPANEQVNAASLTSSSSASTSVSGGGGKPIDITNASGIGTAAAGTIANSTTSAANTIAKTASASTNALTQAGTSLFGSLEQAGTDWVIRIGLILLAITLLAGAWVFFSVESKGSGGEKIVPIPV